MESVRCCKCGKEVRMPEVTTALWVRCPHCASAYPIQEIVQRLPPPLEVIPPPGATALPERADSAAEKKNFELPSDGGDVPLIQTAGTTDQTGRTGVLIDPVSDRKVFVRSPQNLEANRKKAMTRRAKGSPFKVVLGAIAGLVIGQLILWWLPHPYRSDPLGIAPALPKSISFLAPGSLRNDPPALLLKGLDRAIGDELTPAPIGPASGSGDNDDNQGQPADIPKAPTEGPSAAEPVVGLTDAPKIGVPQMQRSLMQATQAIDEFSGLASSSGFSVIYEDLAELAFNITFADMREPDIKRFADDARAFLGKLAADQQRLDAIGIAAAKQFEFAAANDREGILVTGRVTHVAPAGELFQTQVQLSGPQSPLVAVVSGVDPQQRGVFAPGDDVLVVGVIVNDPSLNLLGYQGADDVVVLGGLPIRIPK